MKTAWLNTLALIAVALAIALLAVKNWDQIPSTRGLKVSAAFESSSQPKANR